MKLGFLKPLARIWAATPIGRRHKAFLLSSLATRDELVRALLKRDPNYCVRALFWNYFYSSTFRNALKNGSYPDPPVVRGFEDLTWLFASHYANMGIALLNLDEAAYLYRLAGSLRQARLAEIGRYKGGSTFLLAAAIDEGSTLLSVDNHSEGVVHDLKEQDESLKRILEIFRLDGKVDLVVGDSTGVRVDPESIDLLFIDGDHRYESVRRDYHHWKEALKPGGHLLFHDADNSRPFSIGDCPLGAVDFMRDMRETESRFFTRTKTVGSLVHFVRTTVPFAR
ncbi:MAG: class I SAM-dependent methyltransferase [Candidatus Omnitrophica bacterium]|nr:class I SAM-dependent methyltransferase [Candidatus Omnitrophota bacterium]